MTSPPEGDVRRSTPADAEGAAADADGVTEGAGGAPEGGEEAAAAKEELRQAKEALRQQMRRIRRAIPVAERARRGVLATSSLQSLPELRRAETVLSFSSFGSEVPTADLLGSLHEAGVTVLLPFLDAGEMYVAEHRRGDRLVESSYGPREPLRRRPGAVTRIGAVVVPGLAFDRRGGRLGYGGGHYDRFLRRLPREAVLIGLAFSEQIVAEVPLGENDIRLHVVVTDREVIRCQDGGMEACTE